VDAPTIGMTIYWVIFYGALLQGMWWWFCRPSSWWSCCSWACSASRPGWTNWLNPRLRKEVLNATFRGGAFVFDVDGTLVPSDDPTAGTGGVTVLRGAAEVLERVRARGKRLAVFTNGTGQAPQASPRSSVAGIDIADAEMLTPRWLPSNTSGGIIPARRCWRSGTRACWSQYGKRDRAGRLEEAEHAGVV
jgi:hypothetical protein